MNRPNPLPQFRAPTTSGTPTQREQEHKEKEPTLAERFHLHAENLRALARVMRAEEAA